MGKEFAAFISRSPNVAQLLCRDRMNDDFMAALGPHPSLEGLNLVFATDRSIPIVEQMPALKTLVFADTSVSAKALKRLRANRPDIDVQVFPFKQLYPKGKPQ